MTTPHPAGPDEDGNWTGRTMVEQWMNRKPPVYLPTPWPALDPLLGLGRKRRRTGVVAPRGSREARIGRDVAVHVAATGLTVVLFTLYPPATVPETLYVDETVDLTSDIIQARVEAAGGSGVALVVVERIERLRLDDDQVRYYSSEGVPPSWGDQVMWAARDIKIEAPLLLTTVTAGEPDLSKSLSSTVNSTDHPAMVMTDACHDLLVVRRSSSTTVDVRVEVDFDESQTAQVQKVLWEPLSLT